MKFVEVLVVYSYIADYVASNLKKVNKYNKYNIASRV